MIHSTITQTNTQSTFRQGQERLLATAESVGVFKQLDLQDMKSVAST